MAAGHNVRARIWAINYAADNIVGGAVVTGTVYGDYLGRLEAIPEQQLLLQQGLETERMFRFNLQPGNLPIQERWELEIIEPTDSMYYGSRFRIRSVTYSSLNVRDPRNYMMLILSRSVQAHARQ